MSTETGGPAFPTTKPLDSWGDPNAGMTLRDYFAAKAMQGLAASATEGAWTGADIANYAYSYADCMLSAREQTK